MKRYTIFLLSIMLASCTYEQLQVQVNDAPGKEFILEASIDEPATKSGVGEFGSFYWTASDQLAMYTTENKFRTLTLKEGAGLSTATFTGALNDTEFPAEVAVSPAQITSSYNDGKLEVVLPEKYEYNDNYAIGNPPMYALLGNDNGISFRHLCAMLRFTLDQVPIGASSVRLTSEGGKMAGTFTIALSETPSISRIDSEADNSIAVEFKALDYPKTMTFNFPIPVGDYNNLTIEILNAEKKVLWGRKMRISRTFAIGQLMVFDKISTFPKVIDLGLPSGTLWADRNVGANDVQGYGGLFAWAETTTKTDYTWDDYSYTVYEGDQLLMTKYSTENGLSIIEPSDDVATVTLGNNWRTPTLDEMEELFNECTRAEGGDNGCVFTGPNGNTIVFPYGGTRYNSYTYLGQGHYWTNTLSGPYSAYELSLTKYPHIGPSHMASVQRFRGDMVRPVYVADNYLGLSATSISIFKEEPYDIDAIEVNDADLIWESENETIATVDKNGVVLGKVEGQTTIVVSSLDGKKKQSCVVRVVPDVSSLVSVSFIGGSIVVVNGVIRSGSVLNFTIRNNSSCGIRADRLILINGVSGSEKAYAVNATLSAGESASYSLTVPTAGTQEPKCRLEYRYEGTSYSTECTIPN